MLASICNSNLVFFAILVAPFFLIDLIYLDAKRRQPFFLVAAVCGGTDI
jgi:hypothetical protein